MKILAVLLTFLLALIYFEYASGILFPWDARKKRPKHPGSRKTKRSGISYVNSFSEQIEKSLGSDIQDFINLLPVDDILALKVRYEKNDAQFQDLINHIKSEDFFNFLGQLTSSSEYRKLSTYLIDNGFPESKMLQSFINEAKYRRSVLTRLGRSYNQYIERLDEDMKSLYPPPPTRLGRSYDPFIYQLDEDMKSLYLPPTRFGRSYNQYTELLDEDMKRSYPPPLTRFGRSYNQFIDQLETLIPVEKARQLFKRKRETSPKFRHFYNVISKREFLDLVDKVLELDFVQEELKKIRELGVNLKRLARIVEEMFGLPETFSTLYSL